MTAHIVKFGWTFLLLFDDQFGIKPKLQFHFQIEPVLEASFQNVASVTIVRSKNSFIPLTFKVISLRVMQNQNKKSLHHKTFRN